MSYETLLTNIIKKVAIITLNRPKALNALNSKLMSELSQAIDTFESDEKIGAIIITGNEKAFAAGADIKEMQSKKYIDVFLEDFISKGWESIDKCRKPVIAAVSGFALGGGCEIAMMCDFILASPSAKFGQPEIQLGIIPGSGGTQRLARFIGKSKAMEMVLTGRMMNAEEAEKSGLVSRIIQEEKLLDEAVDVASTIANFSLPAVMMAKESTKRAFETGLSDGINYERKLFYSTFGLEDQSEGMQAFLDKRKPNFINK